jgi:phosphoglycolate phosphatase-like HAD superfamily hydrolase
MLLLLFDIDGTLVRGATAAHASALRAALREVHRIEPDDTHVDAPGRTDGEIARLILLAHGVDAKRIDERAADVRIACCETFGHNCPPDLSDTVIEGIPDLLAELATREELRLALLTGNYEPVARVKLRAAGIGHFFASHEGAFGSDSEDRAELPEIARARAGRDGVPHPRGRTVVIGDTPRDIACARADGVHCLAIATGSYDPEQLAGADGVATTPAELVVLIDQLR